MSEDGNNNKNLKIEQIEGLGLPRRSDKRRSLYVGEGIFCSVSFEKHSFLAEVTDISPSGLSLVNSKQEIPFTAKSKQNWTLHFHKKSQEHFSLDVQVNNINSVYYHKKKFQRIGLSYHFSNHKKNMDEYEKNFLYLDKKLNIFATATHPLFFNEKISFKIIAFSPRALSCEPLSSEAKNLIPGQTVTLEAHLPLIATIKLKTKKVFHYESEKKEITAIYFEFINDHNENTQMIFDFLCLHHSKYNPQKLLKSGFQLDSFAKIDLNPAKSKTIKDSKDIDRSIIFPRLEEKELSTKKLPENLKQVLISFGVHNFASCYLVFVDQESDFSFMRAVGHKIDPSLKKIKYIEFIYHKACDDTPLFYFINALIQSLLRLCIQSRVDMMLLELEKEKEKEFTALGFKSVTSYREASNHQGKKCQYTLMFLPVKKILNKQYQGISKENWDKIYKPLYEFLLKRYEDNKNSLS